jgi:hypothetical protein
MVSSIELSDCIAKALGLPEPTVALHMRNLREEGVLTQGGRGRSAARMSAVDAALLLIASAGSLHPKDSVDTVQKYRDLGRVLRRPRGSPRWRDGLIPRIDSLGASHTFSAAITALIESAVCDELNVSEPRMPIVITFFWPWARARIEYFYTDPETHKRHIESLIQLREHPTKPWSPVKLDAPLSLNYGGMQFFEENYSPIPDDEADLEQERKFTHQTILAIADLMKRHS